MMLHDPSTATNVSRLLMLSRLKLHTWSQMVANNRLLKSMRSFCTILYTVTQKRRGQEDIDAPGAGLWNASCQQIVFTFKSTTVASDDKKKYYARATVTLTAALRMSADEQCEAMDDELILIVNNDRVEVEEQPGEISNVKMPHNDELNVLKAN
ncbi:hypothetical protein AVEN_266519-1 [Araneus ventricosus]|uniref:Uncharacterized protein n=1 Tax=Araneus ventricosus TaxID=182803 RepID=A0A4Y2KVE6_ARAVE|nr:hypothetical protein AVEN_266519-1 [Araneus ventricosus]